MQTDTYDTNSNGISSHHGKEHGLKADAPADAMRTCIVTRELDTKENMLRFVLSPDLIVTYDAEQKLPGRGLYVRPNSDALKQAIEKNAFARAAKSKAVIPDNLFELVQKIVRDKVINALCLANRAGQIGAGSDQCLDILRRGQGGLYVTSSDKGSEMRDRIQGRNPDLPIITDFTDTELGRIIGRPSLTHMIVKKGKLCFKGVHWHQLYKCLTE